MNIAFQIVNNFPTSLNDMMFLAWTRRTLSKTASEHFRPTFHSPIGATCAASLSAEAIADTDSVCGKNTPLPSSPWCFKRVAPVGHHHDGRDPSPIQGITHLDPPLHVSVSQHLPPYPCISSQSLLHKGCASSTTFCDHRPSASYLDGLSRRQATEGMNTAPSAICAVFCLVEEAGYRSTHWLLGDCSCSYMQCHHEPRQPSKVGVTPAL